MISFKIGNVVFVKTCAKLNCFKRQILVFRKLFPRKNVAQPTVRHTRFDGGAPTPQDPLCVIGDIHGQIDCLDSLLAQITQNFDSSRLVFVGDYIDRGDHSAQVLSRLFELSKSKPETIFLMGNHEEMMLSFLKDPVRSGNRWMRYGGLQTMASFGAFRLVERNTPEALIAARDGLQKALPTGLENWLSGLPRLWQSGNVAVVHAGADPEKPIDGQDPKTLTWGHTHFGKQARTDGVWVVHGHTIVDMPQETNGVISIDTGAYATGRLTGAHILSGTVEFVQGLSK
ncbi:MAG: serine/threonine protein phosphatase 1 [Celeribacter sp.]